MDKWILRDAERYASAHRGKRRWYQVMTCLAAVVVFCTTYALILPAITLEKQCQIPEHTHTDSCYTQVTSREKRALACKVEADAVIHKHDAACWDEDGNLVCTLPELEAHRHTDSCYTIPEVHAHTDACYTWERGELTCTQSTEPQHTHTEACYQESSDLVCGTSVSTGHAHGAECRDEDGNLICGQEESQGHTHGEGCYQVSRQLTCGQTEEPAHQHTDECYSWNRVLTCDQSTEAAQPVLTCEKDEIEPHTHQPFVSEEDRGCYGADGKNLVCGKPQVVEHQHTGACFKTVTEAVDTEALTCTLPEDETHTHGPLCYGTWELTCGLEEHTHSPACGSDPGADLETADIWEQTFAEVELTGDWQQDVLAIAGTQLGYTESTANYIVEDDGQTLRGYTRYGAWYGDPYGDWDAMFVSFCLHYAGVDEEFPLKADSASWVQALSDEEYDLYIPAPEPESDPWPGDLIFFNREPELEEDAEPVADHVGLVAEVIPEEGDRPAQIKVIEGDASAEDGSPDAVRYVTYELDDSTILGYGMLPSGDMTTAVYAADKEPLIYFIDDENWSTKTGNMWTYCWGGTEGNRTVLMHYEFTNNQGYRVYSTPLDVEKYPKLLFVNKDVSNGNWDGCIQSYDCSLSIEYANKCFTASNVNKQNSSSNPNPTPSELTDTLSGKTVYFDAAVFEGASIQIFGDSYQLAKVSGDDSVLSYTFPPDSTANWKTQITITKDGSTFSTFVWDNWTLDKVSAANDKGPTAIYFQNAKTIYFVNDDPTWSTENGMWMHCWGDGKKLIFQMEYEFTNSQGQKVYSASLDLKTYPTLVFVNQGVREGSDDTIQSYELKPQADSDWANLCYNASEVRKTTEPTPNPPPSPYVLKDTLAGKTLYFDKMIFDGASIQIDGASYALEDVPDDDSVLFYTFPQGSTANWETQITIIKDGSTFSTFVWDNWTLDKVVAANQGPTHIKGARTIYFDATLSKLSYNGDGDKGTNTIPMANGNSEGDKVYCHWQNSTSSDNVQMTRDHDDVYWADIPKDADNVSFYSSSDGTLPSSGSNMTEERGIPDTLKSPCFYADSSDDAIYAHQKRSGYWGEVDTIRDAGAGKNRTVVDIAAPTQTKNNDILYVNTTLYDYYTDYELNGNNRDNYATDGVDWKTHRIYQPFRQFNQALSAYYETNGTSHPLYWGNFQNYEGSHFRDISATLNLYGYDNNTKQFFAENNSMWGYDGADLKDHGGADGAQATQGLVDKTLSSGTLTMGGNPAPFFSESFLSGSNAKNTVLGKVYHNVSFPFVKQVNNNGVDYWCFDSSQTGMANSNLQLKQDGGRYFLQPTGSGVNGCTTGGQGGTGYFPFNTSDQSGQATRLNYGFGQRFDIQFRLTEDGTVTANNNQKVPVEFNFSGDDDVWVFVDGYLVLDIGGDHGRVDGTINFKERKSTVSRVKKSDNGTNENVTTNFPDALKGGDFYSSEHTLTMFYMERGLWESNMKITFNFPDENLLEVEKQVDTSSVNSLFQSLFNNKDLFTFHIKTMATHFGPKAASGETRDPVDVSLNGTLSTGSGDITFDHTIEHQPVGTDPNGILRWQCRVDDDDGTHRFTRYGQLALSDPVSLSGQQYLQFDFWFNWNEKPSLSKLFVDLRDANGKPLTREYLSVSSCISGSPVMVHDQWITLKLDLDRMGVNRSGEVASIRIGYDLGRNVYIRDMSFQPVTSVHSGQVGFVTPQNDIPDYGTASTGQLAIPLNAVYTSSRGQSYRIGTDGTFTLQNGETVIFHDQFRRGSYMYLEEDANPLYTTTWSMYEGMNQSPVSTSTVPSGATTVGGSGQNMSNVSGRNVADGRVEIASRVAGESDTSGNKYLTDGNNQAPGSTFVFRHYSDPDNTTTTTKLTVKFTNTVNTGSLTIAKAKAEGSEDLGTQKFTFYVEFYNVGGMGLEGSDSILDGPYTIAVGDFQTITGIPIGTQFTIHEVKPVDSGIVLDHINDGKRPGTGKVKDSTTYTVTGSIPSDRTPQSYTFYNSKKSVVSMTVKKAWKSMQGIDMSQNLPTSISVQLQRSADGTTWESVPGYENVPLAPGYTSWQRYSYTFRDLDRNADNTTEYQYRVVELNSDGSVVNGTVTLDDRSFTVTYSDVTNSPENSAPPAYSQTITNMEQPTGYELPKTGGAGTQPYTMGGIALMAAAVMFLLYSHTRRRKEDAPSS